MNTKTLNDIIARSKNAYLIKSLQPEWAIIRSIDVIGDNIYCKKIDNISHDNNYMAIFTPNIASQLLQIINKKFNNNLTEDDCLLWAETWELDKKNYSTNVKHWLVIEQK